MNLFTLTKADVYHIKDALESFQAELEILENDKEWYVSDSKDRVDSALQILYTVLGIDPNKGTDENENQPRNLELRF